MEEGTHGGELRGVARRRSQLGVGRYEMGFMGEEGERERGGPVN